MDKHLVWSGQLYHKTGRRVSSGSLWAVLMRESVLGPKRLELYHTHTDYTNSLPATFVLNLGDMLHVERNLEPQQPGMNQTSHPPSVSSTSHNSYWNRNRFSSSIIAPPRHPFTITMEKEIHVFCTKSNDESSHWVGKLNQLLHGPPEEGVEYEFPVRVFPTALSKSFALRSNHVLKVSESDIRLYAASGTTPSSFVCLLSNVEKVSTDGTHGVGCDVISLQCTNVLGASGTITLSTSSAADIGRILNHRRMAAATTISIPPTTPSNTSISDKHSIVTPKSKQFQRLSHHHQVASQDQKLLHLEDLSSTNNSATQSLPPHLLQGNTHPPATLEKSLPLPPAPLTAVGIGLMTQGGMEESSSSSDSEDGGDRLMQMTTLQQERIQSDRKTSSDDFESVASWVRYKRESLGRGIAGGLSGRVNSSPNIQRSKYPNLSQKPTPLPKPAWLVSMSAGGSSISSKPSSLVQTSCLRRSSSFSSSFDAEEKVHVESIASVDKRKGDTPGLHDSLVSNDLYEQLDSGSWQSWTSAVNESTSDQGQPSSLHDYESIKEFAQKGRQPSIDSNGETPEYDYVKYRILGIRGLLPANQQPAAPYSSDEEEPYYY